MGQEPGPDSRPTDWLVGGQGAVIVREEADVKAGKYAARLTTSLPRGHVLIDKRLLIDKLKALFTKTKSRF